MQLKLKTILFILTACAVLCSAMAPRVRALNPEQRFTFFKYVGVAGCGCLSAVGIGLLLQQRTERSFGRRLLLFCRGGSWSKGFILLTFILVFGNGVLGTALSRSQSERRVEWHDSLTATFLGSMIWIGILMRLWWSSFVIELRERGFVLSGKRFQWQEINRARWDEATGRFSFVLNFETRTVDVPKAERAKVSAILEEQQRTGLLKNLRIGLSQAARTPELA